MGQKRRGPQVNRVLGDRLYDDAGREWHRSDDDVTGADVVRLLADPSVRVALHRYHHPPHWVSSAERMRVWAEEVRPVFVEPGATFEFGSGRRPDPYEARLWRSGGDRLLVFEQID